MKLPRITSRLVLRLTAFCCVTLSLVCIGYGLNVKPRSRLHCAQIVRDFGVVTPESSHVALFEIRNTGHGPIRLLNVTTTCGCTSANASSPIVEGGKTVTISVSFTAGKGAGLRREKCTALFLDEEENQYFELSLYVRAATDAAT